MNHKRIIIGGLVAGVIMNVLDTITNGVIFGKAWEAAYAALSLHPPMGPFVGFWAAFDFAMGLLGVWLYAAMRPRFGAGPGTAIRAALVIWFVLHATVASHLIDGVFPTGVVLGCAACELVSEVVAILVGARLYREA